MTKYAILALCACVAAACSEPGDVTAENCGNGVRDANEQGIDCGGNCAPCPVIPWNGMRVLGVWPAVDNGNGLVRQCGAGPIDGFLFNFALSSSVRSDGDPDNAIHPGDLINNKVVDGGAAGDIALSGTQNVTLDLACIEPLPDANGNTTCEGVQPAETQGNVSYVAHAERAETRNILVVVDVSGSMSGFVDTDSLKEHPNDGSGTANPQLQTAASDFGGFRLSTTKTLLEGLRDTDRVGLLAFRGVVAGTGLDTPCIKLNEDGSEDTLSGLPWRDKLSECFEGPETSLNWWLAGLNVLDGDKNWGRSNLWHAVDKALDFLRFAPPAGSSHVIVITDGPDTCGNDHNATECTAPCAAPIRQQDVLDRIAAAGPQGGPMVHFIQFDSPGYPGPDPQQMEVACASGGHYRFINRTGLPFANLAPFQAALRDGAEAIRLALTGHWQLPVTSPALTSGQTPPGTVLSMAGLVTLQVASGLVDSPELTVMSGGEAGVVDERPKLRKACGSNADCGAGDADCTIGCDVGRTCQFGAPAPNGTSCGSGVCCDSGGQSVCLSAGMACDACQ